MTITMQERKAYTVTDAAKALSISVTQLRRWLRDGTLRYVQRNRLILIPASEIDNFLSNLAEPLGERKS